MKAVIGEFVLKFNTDVSMAGTLRAAVAVDRAVVEQIRAEIEGIDESFQEELADINLKHADVVLKHGEVIAAKDEVNLRKDEIDVIQTNITDQQTDVTDKRDQVNATYVLVQASAAEVEADKAHVDSTVADFNTTAADAVTDVTIAGNTQVSRVRTEGDTQETRVTDEGNLQVNNVQDEGLAQRNLITTVSGNEQSDIVNKGTEQVQRVETKGDQQETRIEVEGNTQVARVTAEGDAQIGRVGAEADRAESEADRAEAEANKATNQADRSKTEADKSTSSANTALTAQSEAETARDQAVAIVHNDEGSITPEAGKYALADSNGHMAIGWTPHLAALYPYSGIIGSVDKSSLFIFRTDSTSFSDKFLLKNPYHFNIAGRFIATPGYDKAINLTPAESTAERAIAFDDIFLDWNGSISTYRSITPRRTTTSYDRDSIATEHGYTKVDTGLYQMGDTFALLLGRVARRNSGAYHPVFNPEGANTFLLDNGSWGYPTGMSNKSFWAASNCFKPSSIDDCFKFRPVGSTETQNPDTWVHPSDGKISKNICNPDEKPYDAIYSDDFTPLYYSAKNVIDRQALLFDSFNRAVAGETFSAAEGNYELVPLLDYQPELTVPSDQNSWLGIPITEILLQGMRIGIECFVEEVQGRSTLPTDGRFFFDATVGYHKYDLIIANHNNDIVIGGYANSYIRFRHIKIIQNGRPIGSNSKARLKNPGRPQYLMVDIIGAEDAWPDEWKSEGLPGNWLALSEEGEDLIPDGSSKNFKLSRKCLECYQVLITNDKGITWSDETSTWVQHFEGSNNSRNYSLPSQHVLLVFYRTTANPFESTSESKLLTVNTDIFLTGYHTYQNGSSLTSSLIGKIPIESRAGNTPLNNYFINENILSGQSDSRVPQHQTPLQLSELTTGPVCKMINFITDLGFLQIIYQELKHDGSVWGDDNKFHIVNNQSTYIDLNGAVAIVGQKKCELPFQFTNGDKY